MQCQDCKKWMKKPDCPKELGVMNGGPTANTPACKDFELDKWRARVRKLNKSDGRGE